VAVVSLVVLAFGEVLGLDLSGVNAAAVAVVSLRVPQGGPAVYVLAQAVGDAAAARPSPVLPAAPVAELPSAVGFSL